MSVFSLHAIVPRPPCRRDEARSLLRAELDAWFARANGLTRDDLRYLLDSADVEGPDFPGDSFRVLKRRVQRARGARNSACVSAGRGVKCGRAPFSTFAYLPNPV